MQVVDANVLLYAINQDTAHHDRARGWFDSALNGEEAVGFTWVVLLAFLRLATRPGLFPRPLDVATATATVELWRPSHRPSCSSRRNGTAPCSEASWRRSGQPATSSTTPT